MSKNLAGWVRANHRVGWGGRNNWLRVFGGRGGGDGVGEEGGKEMGLGKRGGGGEEMGLGGGGEEMGLEKDLVG